MKKLLLICFLCLGCGEIPEYQVREKLEREEKVSQQLSQSFGTNCKKEGDSVYITAPDGKIWSFRAVRVHKHYTYLEVEPSIIP